MLINNNSIRTNPVQIAIGSIAAAAGVGLTTFGSTLPNQAASAIVTCIGVAMTLAGAWALRYALGCMNKTVERLEPQQQPIDELPYYQLAHRAGEAASEQIQGAANGSVAVQVEGQQVEGEEGS